VTASTFRRLWLLGLVVLATSGGTAGNASGQAPNGTAAFFLRGGGARYLALTPLGGGPTRLLQLPSDAETGALEFARDGASVSFLAGSSYYVVDTQALRISRVLTSRQLGAGVQTVSRSPDGRRVAVTHKLLARRSSCRGQTWISVIEANGRSRRLGPPPRAARQSPKRTVFFGGASWSPDGGWLTYDVSRYDDPGDCRLNEYGSSFLFRQAASGKGKVVQFDHTRLFVDSGTWSPDGASVAFTEWHLDRANLFVIRSDGKGRRAIARFGPGDEQALYFLWSRNGSIVALHDRYENGSANLYELDAEAGAERLVTPFTTSAGLQAVTSGYAVVSVGENEVVTISLSDGAIERTTTLTSPRNDLRRDEYDYELAVWLEG
jgi:hypothetical protein